MYVASPFDVPRISADVLSEGEYAKGIKLLTQRSGAEIHYSYSYEQIGLDDTVSKGEFVYDNTPITVNPAMTKIKITAHLEENGVKISGSEETFEIEFVHLNVPETSLGYGKTEFAKGTEYTLANEYPSDENILIYYTLDGTDAKNGKIYSGEKFTLSQNTTVKAVYMSACSKCGKCKDGKRRVPL
ncbi:MAG: chitobiase/beta-hexosaminidase C-terminal domain-containing protein [Clostridiales bacterium]|nr:MAG: chitobiase/beta-hexosaminidase C-terminal domain-containing protein [Clostridiales bacterium]